MSGLTAYAVTDIYDCIQKNRERDFVLKFSAMEIYNEAVRDLLSSDCTPLRLLDDPERGTVVEKLTEETLRDWSHLQELLSICEQQRQIGETSLNETSSRSHQILRMTIESSPHDFSGGGTFSTLSATVNFVDLAGSERASQTLSAGARLKEGCHINRSLLTLGTVIRKLSKGRNGHIPYRDSKLTRILQNSLGGNARTAIICTMSPAHSHVEQSRNTLLFASCAREVSTNAQVNVVMSEKALVKHLQKELARMENELRNAGSTSSTALLREKELMIQKMDHEIKELTHQRDLAQSRVNDLLQSSGDDGVSRIWASETQLNNTWAREYSASDLSDMSGSHHPDVDFKTVEVLPYPGKHISELSDNYEDTSPRVSINSPKFSRADPYPWEESSRRTHDDSEVVCKEVQCIEVEDSSWKTNTECEEKEGKYASEESDGSENENMISYPQKGDGQLSHFDKDYTHRALEQKVWAMQRTIDYLANFYHVEPSPCSSEADKYNYRSLNLIRSASCRAILTTSTPSSPWYEKSEENMSTPPNVLERDFSGRQNGFRRKLSELNLGAGSYGIERDFPIGLPRRVSELSFGGKTGTLSKMGSQTSLRSDSIDEGEEYVAELDEMAKTQPEKRWVEDVAMDEREGDIKTSGNDCVKGLNEMATLPLEKQSNGDLVRVHSMDGMEENAMTSVEDSAMRPNEVDELSSEKHLGDDLVGVAEQKKSQSEDDVVDDGLEQRESQQAEEVPTEEVKDVGLEQKASELAKDVRDVELDAVNAALGTPNWTSEFERQRREIIELWDTCNVPLLHRTYFFLLFKGDQADGVYMEVELRRLSFLKDTFSHGNIIVKDGQPLTAASSIRALNREREMLSRQLQKRFSEKEREELYTKWGIGLATKQRRLQLARRLWTDTKDMNHIEESASLVAKVMKFIEPGHAPKEVFGLSFSPQPLARRSLSWKYSMSGFL